MRGTMKRRIMTVVKKSDRGYKCIAEDHCHYNQGLNRFNAGNFCRHVRIIHPAVFKLICEGLPDERYKRLMQPKVTVSAGSKQPQDVNAIKSRIICGLIKLVAFHNLPMQCMSWEGMQDLVGTQLETCKMEVDAYSIREYVSVSAKRIQAIIREELDGTMVTLQVNGTKGSNGQCVACVSCTYTKECEVIKRILGVIELGSENSCADLEERVEKIKAQFGIQKWQIYTISVHYGSVNLDEDQHSEQQLKQDSNDSKYKLIFEQYCASLGDLRVLQCGRHLLSAIATNATKEHGDAIDELIEAVKHFNNDEYDSFFQVWDGSYPPLPDEDNYGFGTYFMMKALKENRTFFEDLTAKYAKLVMYLNWDLIEEFVSAFEPLYDCAVRIESSGLSDFHIQWLLAFGRIRSLGINRFRSALLKAMEREQSVMQKCNVYTAALYLDPRLNFRGSKLFDGVTKEKIIAFLKSIYDMCENTQEELTVEPAPSTSTSQTCTPSKFSMNDFLTEILGEGTTETTTEQAIREIQKQERWDADDQEFNIWTYWIKRRIIDPRLWILASTVYSAAADHCSSIDDFAHLINSSNHLPENDDDDMTYVKLNPGLLERAVKELFCAEKTVQVKEEPKLTE